MCVHRHLQKQRREELAKERGRPESRDELTSSARYCGFTKRRGLRKEIAALQEWD
jgi:hypothetical protein